MIHPQPAPAVSLRPASALDEPFLFQLFQDAHPEFAMLPLAEEQRLHLVRMQFDAMQKGYAQQFPGSEDQIVLFDGQPAGRLWIQRGRVELRGIDLAILSTLRGRGIGTVILRMLQAEAREAAQPLRISVLKTNARARALYERMGFVQVDENAFYLELEWLA